jgi:hypothetical protein
MSVCCHRLRQEEQEANPQVAAASAAGADTVAGAAIAVAAPKKLRGDKLKRANRRAQPGKQRVVVLSPTGELAQQVTLLTYCNFVYIYTYVSDNAVFTVSSMSA